MLNLGKSGLVNAGRWRLALATLFLSLACAGQTAANTGKPEIVVPAGTTVTLALTSPVMAGTAKAGNSIYAETAFPVVVNNHMAIPVGTYVQGTIDSLTLPARSSAHARFQIRFAKIIFANGYAVMLPPAQESQQPSDVIAAVAIPYVEVSTANDVLLDNGTQIEMVLQLPLKLDAGQVAADVRQIKAGPLPPFKSATQCRPSPGTPDTIFPGTPGTPGTPPTVIPGGPGMPDTVIPGTPGTPGTPESVISGIPAVYCPGPPVVIPDPKPQDYKEPCQITASAQLSGKQLAAGNYEVSWQGFGPAVQVVFAQNGQMVMSLPARVVWLNTKPAADEPEMQTTAGGTPVLRSLRFAGQNFALYFD